VISRKWIGILTSIKTHLDVVSPFVLLVTVVPAGGPEFWGGVGGRKKTAPTCAINRRAFFIIVLYYRQAIEGSESVPNTCQQPQDMMFHWVKRFRSGLWIPRWKLPRTLNVTPRISEHFSDNFSDLKVLGFKLNLFYFRLFKRKFCVASKSPPDKPKPKHSLHFFCMSDIFKRFLLIIVFYDCCYSGNPMCYELLTKLFCLKGFFYFWNCLWK